MTRIFDSHSHLQFPAFDADRSEIVEAMRASGTGTIIVGTNLKTSKAAVELADSLGGDFFSSIAVHPSHTYSSYHDENEEEASSGIENLKEDAFAELLSSSKRIVGVGECGLDFFRIADDADFPAIRERQIDNFLRHIAFARAHGLPLVIHSRDAHADTEGVLRAEKAEGVGGVMHCFTGTVEEAKKYLELGFYVSLTCAVTYGPRKNETENPLHRLARYIPLDRLLIETDSPYLSPAEKRGERNSPLNVGEAAKKIAELKGLPPEEIAGITAKNAQNLFHLAERGGS